MLLSYKFHLRFELYPFASSSEVEKIVRLGKQPVEDVWTPPPNCDIFSTADWPIHDQTDPITIDQKIEGSEENQHRNSLNLNRELSVNNCLDLSRNLIDCGPQKAVGHSCVSKDTKKFTKSEALNKLESLQRAERDWRFGKTAIFGFDTKMNYQKEGDSAIKEETHKSCEESPEQQKNTTTCSNSFTSILTPEGRRTGKVTKARFEPIVGNNTQVGWGVVHFYRDDDETVQRESRTTSHEGNCESSVLCIPVVPSYITPSYFLAWLGEKTREQVSHIRMVMAEQLKRYLVLMKFRNEKMARLWKENWNGRVFNSMEPEICHVVFIKTISFSTPPSTAVPSSISFPALTHDPFTLPSASLIELPTCPVCLERMDDTTGLLTIFCQHVFHCTCLLKWKDSSCPVCRQTNSLSLDLPQERPFGSGQASLCSTCDCTDDLWICLICGNVGCGRYKGGHAKEHWKESAHCFALEIETQYVWDYAGDTWVHRLIRDKDDKKVFELPSQNTHGPGNAAQTPDVGCSDEDLIPRNKLDHVAIEYTHLLSSQLESQRLYFEDLLRKSAAETAAASSVALSASKALEELKVLKEAHFDLKSELALRNREFEYEKTKGKKSAEMARKFSKNLVEERRLSEGLMQRIEHLNQSIASLLKEKDDIKIENSELRDANRDLLFSLSVTEKVREMEAKGESGLVQGELQTGIVSLPESIHKEKAKDKYREKGKLRAKGKTREN